MRDRESTKILPNGAVRYGVYDANGSLLRYEYIRLEDEPTVPGSLWNRANVLPDNLVSLLGLPYEDPQLRHALIAHPGPIKIASYETAGAYEWIVPDLADGKAYKIGVLIIGAGGGGGTNFYEGGSDRSSSVYAYALGGGSGYSKHISVVVLPGETKNVIVGGGGVGGTGVGGGGKRGGTSAFDGIVAGGGGGGSYENSNSNALRSDGSRGNGCGESGSFGFDMVEYDSHSNPETPWQCFNMFEGKEILGSGGCLTVAEDTGEISEHSGGKGPDGLGGGNASASGGESGTAPGCGGGGTIKNKTGGAGADGAVYIYFLGVAEQ